MRRLTKIIAASAALISLCGCSPENDLAEDSFDGSYNMISEGTSVHIVEEEPEQEMAVYVPKGMVTPYASARLDKDQLESYNELVESIGNCQDSIPMMHDATIYNVFLNIASIEQLSFGHVADRKSGDYDLETGRFSIDFTYRLTPQEMSNMNRAAEAVADSIVSELPDNATTYDKLKYFHDYLVINCTSSTDYEYANTVYGALVKGQALCEGYAKAFSYLCNKAGIENMIVTGYTNEAHMWNMVKVNGNWYHVDVTWDKPSGMLAEMYPDMVMYQYFMVTDSVIENDHSIWSVSYAPPKALSTNENYFVKEGLYIDSKDDIDTVMNNAFDKAVSQQKNIAMVKFDTNNLMRSVTKEMAAVSENGAAYLTYIIDAASDKYGVKLNVSWTDFYSGYRTIVFVIEYGK